MSRARNPCTPPKPTQWGWGDRCAPLKWHQREWVTIAWWAGFFIAWTVWAFATGYGWPGAHCPDTEQQTETNQP